MRAGALNDDGDLTDLGATMADVRLHTHTHTHTQ